VMDNCRNAALPPVSLNHSTTMRATTSCPPIKCEPCSPWSAGRVIVMSPLPGADRGRQGRIRYQRSSAKTPLGHLDPATCDGPTR